MTDREARSAVRQHVAAFNAHDTQRLLAGFADEVVWNTGQDIFRGIDGLKTLFDDGLWELDPALSVGTLVSDEGHVAIELTERITVDGEQRTFDIAAFFAVRAGRIISAKIYREGSADIE